MRPFLILPGIARWELVDLEPPLKPPVRPLISGRFRPVAALASAGGRTPPIRSNHQRVESRK